MTNFSANPSLEATGFADIILSTLNARYAHTSMGLHYLYANMGTLQAQTQLMEFVIGASSTQLAEKLLAHSPKIVAFGVYIWNVVETTQLVAILKRLQPTLKIILGGPEVSYENSEQAIVQLADFVVTGWGEVTFPHLCQQILKGPPPIMKIHAGVQASLNELELPYAYYSDHDIKHRVLYVEASRGCPFKCEFCLSALDKTAWPFELTQFLQAMEVLYQRGARLFKFVDRTFNLNIKTSLKIMDFFLEKIEQFPNDPIFAHFEVVPDHLPDALKASIMRFPAGSLQFEIGIQSFNPSTQTLVSRKQDNAKAAENIRWLIENSHAHLHVDLIAGLPGENVASFAQGFNTLYALKPHEIQFGILKRLRGTPIIRHTVEHQLIFDPAPPYSILATKDIDFSTMQRLVRFGRYWDLVANSGRFTLTLPLILAKNPFERFLAFSDWLYQTTDSTHKIALERLAKLVTQWLKLTSPELDEALIRAAISQDYAGLDMHKTTASRHEEVAKKSPKKTGQMRQQRHLNANSVSKP